MAAHPSVDTNVHIPTLEDRRRQPWKYLGYREFCKFVASDDDFFVLRRFSVLSSRILLALQDELSELEGQLDAHEKELTAKSALNRHNGTFREEFSEIRLDLVHEIDRKLRAYNELVLQHSELRKRPPVPSKDRRSLANWFSNHKNAIAAAETEYVQHAEDLFAIVPKSKTPLRRFMERSQHFRLFRGWMKPSLVEDENVHYTSDQRIDMFVNSVIALIGLIMLIVPLWWLAFVTPVRHRLAIITSFVVVFLCFVSFTTVARPFETLGAAAA
jgi:hypothetical protein